MSDYIDLRIATLMDVHLFVEGFVYYALFDNGDWVEGIYKEEYFPMKNLIKAIEEGHIAIEKSEN